jgi:hypothetical protein
MFTRYVYMTKTNSEAYYVLNKDVSRYKRGIKHTAV